MHNLSSYINFQKIIKVPTLVRMPSRIFVDNITFSLLVTTLIVIITFLHVCKEKVNSRNNLNYIMSCFYKLFSFLKMLKSLQSIHEFSFYIPRKIWPAVIKWH